MSHTTKRVNGIETKFWDGARDPMGVESETRSFAGSLPRGGELDDHDGHIKRVEGPSYVGGDVDVWFDGQLVGYTAPDGYSIKNISVFESGGTCITLEQE